MDTQQPIRSFTNGMAHALQVDQKSTSSTNAVKYRACLLALQGDMLCCETCPATFHKECIGLEITPEGDWWCPLCVCAVCGQARFQTQALPATAKRVGPSST